DARVDFRTPQAAGWAVGVHYLGRSNSLTLDSQVHVTLTGDSAATIIATHGQFTSEPHQLVLENPRMTQARGRLQSDRSTFFLGADNEVQRVLAVGDVIAESAETVQSENGSPAAPPMRARADQADLLLHGTHNQMSTAVLAGNVQVDRIGSGTM